MKLRHMGTNSTKILTTLFANEITMTTPVADPGFSPGGCANSQNCYYFSNFCRKLHENERIWTPRGGACPWRPRLDPPMHTQHKDMTPMRTVLVTSVSLVKISAVTSGRCPGLFTGGAIQTEAWFFNTLVVICKITV